MFSEIFLAALAGKIVDKALDALAQRTGVQEVRRVLTGDPARAALIRALRKAYAGLEERYPYLASKDFHEIFFRQDEVIDELARVIGWEMEEYLKIEDEIDDEVVVNGISRILCADDQPERSEN